jgi:hypothetical protein
VVGITTYGGYIARLLGQQDQILVANIKLGTRVRVRAILTGECRWGLPEDDVEVD